LALLVAVVVGLVGDAAAAKALGQFNDSQVRSEFRVLPATSVNEAIAIIASQRQKRGIPREGVQGIRGLVIDPTSLEASELRKQLGDDQVDFIPVRVFDTIASHFSAVVSHFKQLLMTLRETSKAA